MTDAERTTGEVLSRITIPRIAEIESRYINGFFEYSPDRWGIGVRVLAGFTYGGWLGLNLTLGPLKLDLEMAHNS